MSRGHLSVTTDGPTFVRALILHYISHASIQMFHVQSFILMSSFLCSINCLPQAWLLVGQAVRSAQDLGLHVSISYYLMAITNKVTALAAPISYILR